MPFTNRLASILSPRATSRAAKYRAARLRGWVCINTH